ncbi:MAG TPA: ribonuclease Y [Jatrophihabitans sp.]|uniref:ribonuclease Y n=1 Tax=Jatrophihabitans sp. TaxID=1932789 RepID=UPI002E04D501|nr:ribonuclease Y [Jatrophihabitans sp.]
MNGVWYAAVGAAFVLGLLFVFAYSRRSTPPGRHGEASSATVAAGSDEVARRSAELEAGTAAAVAEASALRKAAQTEAEGLRRVAEAEAEATRRTVRTETESARGQVEALLARAREQAAGLIAEARRSARAEVDTLTGELQRQLASHAARTARLEETEARLDAQEARLAQRAAELQRRSDELAARKSELDERSAELETARVAVADATREHERELERIAGLSADDAKGELLATVEAGARREAAVLVRAIEGEARAEGTERARSIVVEAVQRVASAQTTETVVSVLHLPAEEMKGRIIGREGRNIRSFEAVTGVNVIIDDTPEAVLLSCFDPVRREVGRLTLEKLILDGRIHPHRIEEAHEQSKIEVEELCLRAARDALADVGIGPIDERLMPTLGRLKYRTSYGQNVLGHLVETAHIAGVMAAELGVEPTLVKRCAFLHDIGKALTHEVEGSHAIIGAELLRKFGEDEAVAHAVEAHHNEVQPKTIEAVLTQASDTCSAARPGARRESLESYVKRLARIEEIAGARPGVEKVFAMQSGREVRVMVQPTEVDDLASSVMAREIAKQIEDELTYPGQIRVTVVRESRSTEIAH